MFSPVNVLTSTIRCQHASGFPARMAGAGASGERRWQGPWPRCVGVGPMKTAAIGDVIVVHKFGDAVVCQFKRLRSVGRDKRLLVDSIRV